MQFKTKNPAWINQDGVKKIYLELFYFNGSVKICINQYTTTVFANHNFFMLAYFTLLLGRVPARRG